ncbi:hypothetical protein ACQEU6_25750 [Spirillospora sp. CA-108201]
MRDMELRHGYTYGNLEGIARKASLDSKWRYITLAERYDIAWSAVTEALYSSEDPPYAYDLIQAGMRAIARHVEEDGQLRGVYYYQPGKPRMPRFETYWWDAAGPTPSPENRIIERIATRHIFERLTPANQRVLLALADYNDYTRAAEALGISRKSFITYVCLARKQFLRLWHDDETPSRVWGRDHNYTNKTRSRSITAVTIRRRRARRLKSPDADRTNGKSE